MFIWSKNAFLAVLPPQFLPKAKIGAGEENFASLRLAKQNRGFDFVSVCFFLMFEQQENNRFFISYDLNFLGFGVKDFSY